MIHTRALVALSDSASVLTCPAVAHSTWREVLKHESLYSYVPYKRTKYNTMYVICTAVLSNVNIFWLNIHAYLNNGKRTYA